jgi:hypothetical protein
VTMSVIPFRITGRMESNIFSSESEYNWRVLNPPPVERHNVSDIQVGIVDISEGEQPAITRGNCQVSQFSRESTNRTLKKGHNGFLEGIAPTGIEPVFWP